MTITITTTRPAQEQQHPSTHLAHHEDAALMNEFGSMASQRQCEIKFLAKSMHDMEQDQDPQICNFSEDNVHSPKALPMAVVSRKPATRAMPRMHRSQFTSGM